MTVVSGSTTKKQTGGQQSVVVDTAEKPSCYGIRSHLNEFYDWRSAFTANDGDEGWYLMPQSASPNRRRLVYVFRAMTIIGLMLLVLGAVLILVAYMWPQQSHLSALVQHLQQGSRRSEDGELYIDPRKIPESIFEDKSKPWKLAGLIIFACGGTILSISLLVPTCARLFGRESLTSDLNTPVEPPVKIFPTDPAVLASTKIAKAISPPSSPTERKVPAIEEISAVQPKTKQLDGKRRPSGDELLLMEEK